MQLTTQLPVAAIVVSCLGGTFAVLANMISLVMIGKINERTPENERMSNIGFGSDVRRRFKVLYSGNRLVLLFDSCVALMLLCCLVLLKVWVFK